MSATGWKVMLRRKSNSTAFRRLASNKELLSKPPLGGEHNVAPEGLNQTTSRAGGRD